MGLLGVIGSSCGGRWASKEKIAFEKREEADWATAKWVKFADQMGGKYLIQRERWKNAQTDAAKLPGIGEIIAIQSMTVDSPEPCIVLIGVDGKKATLWLSPMEQYGQIRIRNISS